MIRPVARNWWIFGVCAVSLFVAMIFLSIAMVRLDEEKAIATAETEHQIAVSTALWRMDSWLGFQLAGEATRPYFEYESFYPQLDPYTKMLGEVREADASIPSNLLSYRSEYFPLHFQIDARGRVTSPQVPGKTTKVFESADLPLKTALLKRFRTRATTAKLSVMTCFNSSESNHLFSGLPFERDRTQRKGGLPNWRTYESRARVTDQSNQIIAQNNAFQPNVATQAHVTMGPLLPVWIDADATDDSDGWLVFVRRVNKAGQEVFQGILADWPTLRRKLLAEAADLFPGTKPRLVRHETDAEERSGLMLSTVPAKLEAAFHVPDAPIAEPTRLILGIAWVGLILTVLAVGFALHSTNRYGERRARFASAVTHELRTPLTTFRMYSEMLADDMVRDPEQRTDYLNTLRFEADRLSRLVENVLSYSRLEEGRYNSHVEEVPLTQLLERIRPPLEHRTVQAAGELNLEVTNDEIVEIDVDAVSQILFNLVDNACKYGFDQAPPQITITATHAGDHASITVSDQGPGIPANVRTKIFNAFERGTREAGDNETPGVGLGLALARGLAQDLGGQLHLLATTEDGTSQAGAAFTFQFPARGKATRT